MRDASVPDTAAAPPPPRRGGYDVNGRLFSDPQSSIDGIMNSILRGTAHDSALPRLSEGPSSTPSLNGSFFGDHGPILPPPEPCNFPGCEAHCWMATPFCFQHLSRVQSKGKGKGKAPASVPASSASTSSASHPPLYPSRDPPPQTAQPATAASGSSASPLPRSVSPNLPRNAVLSPESSTTYMRRKTAPGTGSRPTPLTTIHSPFLPRMEQQPQTHNINGAPVTPSSRAGGESPGGSYFASSHTHGPWQNGAAAHSHGDHGESSRKDDDTSANGASSILTPSESPPELRALHSSRKRSRSDSQDGAPQNQNQTNGAHTAPAGKDKGVETPTATAHPNEVNGVQPANGQTTSTSGTPASNIVGNPQTQTNTSTAQVPPIAGPSSRPETAAGPTKSSTASLPAKLGLRQALQRRIQERDRERAKNAVNGTTPHASPKEAMPYSLDTYIYSQGPDVAPLPPPPNVTIISKERLEAASASVAAPLPTAYSLSSSASPSVGSSSSPKKAPDYVYAHIDPRVHWTRARPKDWHDAKQKEIKARGGRKANFGKAAQRAVIARRRDVVAAATAAASAVAATELPPVESPTVAEPETNGSSFTNEVATNTRSARQKEKAPARPSPPQPVVVPPPQAPSVWTGELPAEVACNKPWMSLLSKFARDEEAWRTAAVAKQPTAAQAAQKSSVRSKRY